MLHSLPRFGSLPSSPPGEKATAGKDQAGQARASDRTRNEEGRSRIARIAHRHVLHHEISIRSRVERECTAEVMGETEIVIRWNIIAEWCAKGGRHYRIFVEDKRIKRNAARHGGDVEINLTCTAINNVVPAAAVVGDAVLIDGQHCRLDGKATGAKIVVYRPHRGEGIASQAVAGCSEDAPRCRSVELRCSGCRSRPTARSCR